MRLGIQVTIYYLHSKKKGAESFTKWHSAIMGAAFPGRVSRHLIPCNLWSQSAGLDPIEVQIGVPLCLCQHSGTRYRHAGANRCFVYGEDSLHDIQNRRDEGIGIMNIEMKRRKCRDKNMSSVWFLS